MSENDINHWNDEGIKADIDRWIEENGLNKYGDPKDTVYTGGTPLFDETTGKSMDRYHYILKRHPELLKEIEK
ncbi:MAG: hypothetical protein ACMUIS_05330 [bacterium]